MLAVKIKAGSITAGLVASMQLQDETRAPCANISFVTVAGGGTARCDVTPPNDEYITGEAIYDDPGETVYAYGVSIVDGQVTWNDADMPQ